MDVYIAHTPYHLMLCILNGCLNRKSIVYLLDKSGNLKWYSDGVSSFFNNNLRYIDISESSLKSRLINNNPLTRSTNLSKLSSPIREMKDTKVDEIYVFNDSIPEVQSILASFISTKAIYIEDGSAPYNSHSIKNQASVLLKKIFFGFKYEQIKVLGTSSYIEEGVYSFPNLVRRENSVKSRKPFYLTALSLEQLKAYSSLFDNLIPYVNERNVFLYLLPPYKDNELVEAYMRIINDHPNFVHFVKAHPLSADSAYEFRRSIVLPPFIPTEAILFVRPIKRIYAYPTTSLMATRFFERSISTNCIVTKVAARDVFFESNMKSTGVSLWFQ